MGEVLLGLPGPWADDYRERADHYTCKIGGLPDWPSSKFVVHPELLHCSLCGGDLCLVLQIYAPVSIGELTTDERVIYILACPEKQCAISSQCWKALRVQMCARAVDPSTDNRQNGEAVESNEGCDQAQNSSCTDDEAQSDKDDESSDDDFDLGKLARALEEAAKLASQPKMCTLTKPMNGNAPQHLQGKSALVLENGASTASVFSSSKVLPCFYLYCEKEKTSGKAKIGSASHDFISLENAHDSASDQEDKWDTESYEYDRALGADRTYLKFKKRLDLHQEQCFRYFYGGLPLLATEETRGPGTCKLCGSVRHFELQLMPPLLYFIHEAADNACYSADHWSWMTLVVYTCSKSCCPSACATTGLTRDCHWGIVEEEVMIQED